MTEDTKENLKARIRELEAALEEAWGVIANASDWIPKEPGTPCEAKRREWQEAAERWRDERFHPLIATPPPDSEPAEDALEGLNDLVDSPNSEAALAYDQVGGEPAEGEGDEGTCSHCNGEGVEPMCEAPELYPRECPQCSGTGREPKNALSQQQDAMLERRDTLEIVDEVERYGHASHGDLQRFRANCNILRRYLSRTSDEGDKSQLARDNDG